jgi:hypothetical protein
MTVDEWRASEGMLPLPASGTTEETRSLSAAETSQKVYLAVQAGVLSITEARQMIVDAGGKLDVTAVPEIAEPEPTGTDGVRSLRSPTWRR